MKLSEFLDLMNGDLANEWTHLQFYLHHSSAIEGMHAEEYREFFTESAKGEMEHVQAFTDRLFGLNYPAPCATGKPARAYTRPETALLYAASLEAEVVENYAQRLEQIDQIEDTTPGVRAYLKVFYEDQLQDSYEDGEKIRRRLNNFVGSASQKTGD